MATQISFLRRNGFRCAFHPNGFHGVVTRAARPNKGFGGVRKANDQKTKHDSEPTSDKQTFKEAAAAISTHRPVKPEEAARGKLDYVQVADWGDGDRAKLGELRLLSHVQQYEGSGSSGAGAAAEGGTSRVVSRSEKPFHLQLAHQLQMAEARGALAVAGPAPPAVSEWSFREERYAQYLADQLEVHRALEEALLEATAAAGASVSASPQLSRPRVAGPASAAPVQDAVRALQHLAPGQLGLERSAAIRHDLEALRATAGYPAALAVCEAVAAADAATAATAETASAPAAAADGATAALPDNVELRAGDAIGAPVATASKSDCRDTAGPVAGPMARSYAHVLRRLGRVAASGDRTRERQGGALQLLAHAAVLHLVAQAAGVRLGATATERLALMQRRAAATYHHFPEQVTDPRVTLSRALDAAGEHLRSPDARQVVFDEVASAMQKTGLLLSALAHSD